MSEQNERPAERGGLSGLAIRRPVFTTMVMLGLMVLGIFGYRRLPIDQFPDVDIPVVVVQTVYAGASPETVEREVTKRLEEAFNPVEGVDKITSVSLEGVSQVVVEFDLGRDGDQAAQDVRAKIDAVRRELPTDIEQPVVWWQGDEDNIVPLAHAQHIVPLLPKGELRIREGDGHLSGFGIAPEVLETVLAW